MGRKYPHPTMSIILYHWWQRKSVPLLLLEPLLHFLTVFFSRTFKNILVLRILYQNGKLPTPNSYVESPTGIFDCQRTRKIKRRFQSCLDRPVLLHLHRLHLHHRRSCLSFQTTGLDGSAILLRRASPLPIRLHRRQQRRLRSLLREGLEKGDD